MEDADRRALTVTDHDRYSAGKQMPDAMFESWLVKPSLGDEKMKEFRGKQSWAGPKPDSFHETACMTAALIEFSEDLAKLQKLWLAKLVEAGCFLVKMDAADHVVESGYVLAVNDYGVLSWRCVGQRRGDFKWWTFRASAGRAAWAEVRIIDLDLWTVYEVDVLPPAMLWKRELFCRPASNGGGLVSHFTTDGVAEVLGSAGLQDLWVITGLCVGLGPGVLASESFKVRDWKQDSSRERTLLKRPDLGCFDASPPNYPKSWRSPVSQAMTGINCAAASAPYRLVWCSVVCCLSAVARFQRGGQPMQCHLMSHQGAVAFWTT